MFVFSGHNTKNVQKQTDEEVTGIGTRTKNRSSTKKLNNEMMQFEDTLDQKTKRKGINKAVIRKTSKDSGKAYVSKKGKEMPSKRLKKNPCKPESCSNGCYKISEEERQNVFQHYWSLSRARKRDWLISNSSIKSVKRKRVKGSSRRIRSFEYYINKGEDRQQICQQFLLKTLDIGQKFVRHNLTNYRILSSNNDLSGRHSPPNKTSSELINAAKEYLRNLPALPSHYGTTSSAKLYLPKNFKSVANLYKIYKETEEFNGRTVVNEKVFRSIFKTEFDYGFHVPRKDKCLQCLKYKNEKSPEIEKNQNLHLKDKEETYERLKMHENMYSKDNSILCVSFDIQKTLYTPYGKNNQLIYYRKLCVYNITFYECGTKDGHCYTWSEIEGQKGANEICSIMDLFIKKIDDRETCVRRLLLYSDCCPSQNRNKIVISCIQKCLEKCNNLEMIQLNYLLPGHAYMPGESMHSVIEKSLQNTHIWTPSQWALVFGLARKSLKQYTVTSLTHNNFMDWEGFVQNDFDRLSSKLSKVRTVTLKKSVPRTLYMKYSMHPEAETEEIIFPEELKQNYLKRAYISKLPISIKKQEDFNKMCSLKIIPEAYHSDYLNLSSEHAVDDDFLQDTDIEDIIDKSE